MADDTPTITILLLGDADVGKSTFLSRLTLGTTTAAAAAANLSTSTATLSSTADPPPPYSLPTLSDLSQPFLFNIRLYARPYTFAIHDTASPENYTLLKPDFVIFCFDVARRSSLAAVVTRWKNVVAAHFERETDKIPLMLLGLKRDLRREWTPAQKARVAGAVAGLDGRRGGVGAQSGGWMETEAEIEREGAEGPDWGSVMPEEGVRVAQELRCDRYAECSAVTGELCKEVLEDVAKTAAKTTTEKGAKTEQVCEVM